MNNSYLEFYEHAAKMADAEAQRILGEKMLKGQGVAKDIPKAMEFLKCSALNGDSEAQQILGNLFENKADYVQAYFYYSLSKKNNGDKEKIQHRISYQDKPSIDEAILSTRQKIKALRKNYRTEQGGLRFLNKALIEVASMEENFGGVGHSDGSVLHPSFAEIIAGVYIFFQTVRKYRERAADMNTSAYLQLIYSKFGIERDEIETIQGLDFLGLHVAKICTFCAVRLYNEGFEGDIDSQLRFFEKFFDWLPISFPSY